MIRHRNIERICALAMVLAKILVIQILLPAAVTLAVSEFMRKKGWIKFGDMKLEL